MTWHDMAWHDMTWHSSNTWHTYLHTVIHSYIHTYNQTTYRQTSRHTYIPFVEVTFDPNSDFLLSSRLEVCELGEDCFVTKGSGGTGSSMKKKRNSSKASKCDKLVDVGLLRMQFTSKLGAHLKFCTAALREAKTAASAFKETHQDLQNQYDNLVASGIKEDRVWR